MKQLSLDFDLAGVPSLDDFVCSEPAQEQLLSFLRAGLQLAIAAVADDSAHNNFQNDPNGSPTWHTDTATTNSLPAYFWGDTGCGKTHLLHAVMHDMQQNGQTVGYLDANSLTPQAFDDHWRLLIVDDAHALLPWQQQVAFSWFVQAQETGCWILAAGRYAPSQLVLRDDLKSRLGWGHVFALGPLPEEDRRMVLQRAAHVRGMRLSESVIDFILTRFSRDLSHLMLLLEQIDKYAMSEQRAVTVPMLRRMMEDELANLIDGEALHIQKREKHEVSDI